MEMEITEARIEVAIIQEMEMATLGKKDTKARIEESMARSHGRSLVVDSVVVIANKEESIAKADSWIDRTEKNDEKIVSYFKPLKIYDQINSVVDLKL